MSFVVRFDVDVDFDELDTGIIEVIGYPLRIDQDVFGVSHCGKPPSHNRRYNPE